MTNFFTPRFPISPSWQKTFSAMSSIFNKKKFVIEDTFRFEDFELVPNFNGMAATGLIVRYARALKIKNIVWIKARFEVTLAAPFAQYIGFSIPYTARNEETQTRIGHSVFLEYTGGFATPETGTVQILSGSNTIGLYRAANVNYVAGLWVPKLSFFLEVEE